MDTLVIVGFKGQVVTLKQAVQLAIQGMLACAAAKGRKAAP